MNGARFGIETVKDGDAEGSTDSAYFTKNDRDGSWNSATATRIRLSVHQKRPRRKLEQRDRHPHPPVRGQRLRLRRRGLRL